MIVQTVNFSGFRQTSELTMRSPRTCEPILLIFLKSPQFLMSRKISFLVYWIRTFFHRVKRKKYNVEFVLPITPPLSCPANVRLDNCQFVIVRVHSAAKSATAASRPEWWSACR